MQIQQSLTTLFLFAGFVFTGCSSGNKEEPRQPQNQNYYYEPAPQYQAPTYTPETPTTPEPPAVSQEESNPITEQQDLQPQKNTTISRYYEEGYDKGYDDGEDDAVMDNGWGGQFDDECRYTGQKKKDYQLGYEEGYEAGYYDNKESDE